MEKINISRSTTGDMQYREETSEFNPEANAARDAEPHTTSRVHNGSVSVNIRGGEVQAEHSPVTRVTTGEVVAEKMAENPGSVLASARSPSTGRALSSDELTGESRVSIDGMDTTLAVAEAMGVVAKDENGRYYDTREPLQLEDRPTTEQAGREAELAMYQVPEVVRQVTLAATEGLPGVVGEQALLNTLLGEDVNTAQLSSRSGIPEETIAANLNAAAAGLVQSMSDRYGLEPAQVGELLSIVDQTDGQEAIKNSLRNLIAGNGLEFNKLAQKAIALVPPTDAELESRGYKTKTDPQTKRTLVLLDDVWVDSAVARRIGEL